MSYRSDDDEAWSDLLAIERRRAQAAEHRAATAEARAKELEALVLADQGCLIDAPALAVEHLNRAEASDAALQQALAREAGNARTEIEWLRGQIFALCEDTEAAYDAVKFEDDKMGSYARGRIKEAKSIRNAIDEVVRERLNVISTATPHPWGEVVRTATRAAKLLDATNLIFEPELDRALDDMCDAVEALPTSAARGAGEKG